MKKNKFSQLDDLRKVAEQIKGEYQSESELEALAFYLNWINAERSHRALFYCLQVEIFQPFTEDEEILDLWAYMVESITTWTRTKQPDNEHVANYIEANWKDEPEKGIARIDMLKNYTYSQLKTLIRILSEGEENEGG